MWVKCDGNVCTTCLGQICDSSAECLQLGGMSLILLIVWLVTRSILGDPFIVVSFLH